ncbi:DUF5691 domain-containing protein [Streptomyces sp. URMC 123]|uniref:DUF5691 domain-containing protein n=1 Tax=Streptomyces sp. URMC 123 TaxID=3423403 RepID=UPI003F1B7B8F
MVAAALLGTERRSPPVPLQGRSAPAALLDAAAVSTVRRRAGLRPAPARPRPRPAPEDARPPLPAAARRRLAALLADRAAPGRSGGRRGAAVDLVELLPQWLAAANDQGFRAPAELLPALLEAARARTDLRPGALTLAGPRGLWLAGLNPEWRFALRSTAPFTVAAVLGPAPPEPAASTPTPGRQPPATSPPTERAEDTGNDPERVRRLWEEGLFAERVALLAALRERNPAAALALLDSTWASERPEDRLMFVDTLRTGLSPTDEPFLDRALADRSRTVRALAAELLSALPGSALAARMARRAASCVSLDRTGLGPGGDGAGGPGAVVVVEAPHECDAAMRRDGVVPDPPAGCGERAWWLGQLVEAAPLGIWASRLGGRSPAEIVALPVADAWGPELHGAWCRAAVRQRDREWARALLGCPTGAAPDVSPGRRAQLLTVLPPDERAGWVAGFIAAHGLSDAFQLLGGCAVPWAGPLGRAVVDALDIARDAGSYPWSFSGVMGLAERCLDPGEADRLEVLTAIPEEAEEAAPGAGGYWSEAFRRLVDTLRLRAAMRAELGLT